MSDHIFVHRCIDFAELLKETKLSKMLKVAHKQSTTEEAKKRVNFSRYKEYDNNDKESDPVYFGLFNEWLAWHFLNHYGHVFNVQGMEMTASVGSSEEDYGVDGRGTSVKAQLMRTTSRKAAKDAPVYLQVKGTMNRNKEYTPNDGSRLPNFATNAMSDAIRSGHAYQARYVLFTTGKGIHFSLEKMTNKFFEVINYKKISGLMDDDTVFLNRLRASVGLPVTPAKLSKKDPEASYIQNERTNNE